MCHPGPGPTPSGRATPETVGSARRLSPTPQQVRARGFAIFCSSTSYFLVAVILSSMTCLGLTLFFTVHLPRRSVEPSEWLQGSAYLRVAMDPKNRVTGLNGTPHWVLPVGPPLKTQNNNRTIIIIGNLHASLSLWTEPCDAWLLLQKAHHEVGIWPAPSLPLHTFSRC